MEAKDLEHYSFNAVLGVAYSSGISHLPDSIRRDRMYDTLRRIYKLHDKWVENLVDTEPDQPS